MISKGLAGRGTSAACSAQRISKGPEAERQLPSLVMRSNFLDKLFNRVLHPRATSRPEAGPRLPSAYHRGCEMCKEPCIGTSKQFKSRLQVNSYRFQTQNSFERLRFAILSITCIVALLVCASSALAQTATTGALTGVVTDPWRAFSPAASRAPRGSPN